MLQYKKLFYTTTNIAFVLWLTQNSCKKTPDLQKVVVEAENIFVLYGNFNSCALHQWETFNKLPLPRKLT